MKLWLWGNNYAGALGDGTTEPRSSPVQTITTGSTWSSAHVGYSGAIALKTDGSLWAWGYNGSGSVGDGTTINRSSPVHISQGKTWKSLGASNYNYGVSCAIDTSNKLFLWGENGYGQLGQNDTDDRSSPSQMGTKNWLQAAVSGSSAGAIDTNKKLFMWGRNNDGELGLGDQIDRSSPVQVGTDNWNMVATGYNYTMAIKSDSTLWGWGKNDSGQLGLGDTTYRSSPVQLGSATNWEKIVTSVYHSAALTKDGSLYMWGYNGEGQLGQNDTTDTSSPVQVDGSWDDVSCGEYHTIALKADGSVWCFGSNYYGQLGDNTTDNRSSPTQIHGQAQGWTMVSAGYGSLALAGEAPPSKSCSSLSCPTPAFKCYVGVTESCACAKWKFYTAQCTRIQQALGICSGTSGAYVPAIVVCNQRLI